MHTCLSGGEGEEARQRTPVDMDVARLDAALSCSLVPPIRTALKLSGHFPTQDRTVGGGRP